MTNVVQDYGWKSTEGTYSFSYLTPMVLDILKTLNAKRVCDIGSGNGATAGVLHGAGYYVVGAEYDSNGVKLSQSTYPNINFYNLGVQDNPQDILDQEGELFDVVISTEVIEHLFLPHQLPIFAHKLLVKDGYLVITTPYHGYLKNLVLSLLNKWDKHHTALWDGGHIKFWSRAPLTQLLEENGFKVINFKGAGRLPWLWKSMILIAKKI